MKKAYDDHDHGRNVRQAAEYLGISESKLRELVTAGKGPKYTPYGSRKVFYKDDLDDFRNRRG